MSCGVVIIDLILPGCARFAARKAIREDLIKDLIVNPLRASLRVIDGKLLQPRFVNLNNYLWSERWLERYREMDFIQNVLNGMASRRPRLDALRDSWHDLDEHYDALEMRFWQFYPRMMTQAKNKQL